MYQDPALKKAGDEVANVLHAFFEREKKQHRKDGTTALESLEQVFQGVQGHQEWGKLVFMPMLLSSKKPAKIAYHIAAAVDLLATSIVFQTENTALLDSLSVAHFPAKSQAHAAKSIRIVLGDLALTLMHNLLLTLPANDRTILEYEEVFSNITQRIFSKGILRTSNLKLFENLFVESVQLGLVLSKTNSQTQKKIHGKAQAFSKNIKKESTFADSFYSYLQN